MCAFSSRNHDSIGFFCSPNRLTGRFSNNDGDRNKNVKKQQLRTCITLFLYISLPSLHDYDAKMPNFTFYRGPKQAKTNFSFSFSTYVRSVRNQPQGKSPIFDIFNELEQTRQSLSEKPQGHKGILI